MNCKLYLLALAMGIMTFASSCKKDPGPGGTSTIHGKVRTYKYDNTATYLYTKYYSREEDVYIIYGTDHTSYDDHYKTSYDGSYEFKYLQKGTYKIFAYSTDTTGAAATGSVNALLPKTDISQTAEITGKNQTVEVPDIEIIKIEGQ